MKNVKSEQVEGVPVSVGALGAGGAEFPSGRPVHPADTRGRASTVLATRSVPETLDEESRSVEAVLSTDGGVDMYDWWTGEMVREHLVPEGHELAQGRTKVPLLDSHSRFRAGDQLGSIDEIRVEDGKLVGRLTFATTNRGEEAWKLVREGHLTDVSVGYRVEEREILKEGDKWEDKENARKYEGPARVVTKWRLFEASVTPIGADNDAQMRAAGDGRLSPLQGSREGSTQTQGSRPGLSAAAPSGLDGEHRYELGGGAVITVTGSTSLNKASGKPAGEGGREAGAIDEERRSENGAPEESAVDKNTEQAPNGAPETDEMRAGGDAGTAEVVNVDAIRGEGMKTERTRQAEIRQAAVMAKRAGAQGVDEVMNKAIDDDWTAEKARTKLFGLVEDEEPVNAARGVSVGREPQDDFGARAADAMVLRAGLKVKEPTQGADELRGASMLDLARDYLILHGQFRAGMNAAEIVKRAGSYRAAGAHTTSDFVSDVLENAMNKSLQAGVAEAEPIYTQIARRVTLNDLRPHPISNIGTFPNLTRVNEMGEVEFKTVSGKKESITGYTYAAAFSISDDAIINDDLDAFTRVMASMGRAAMRTVDEAVIYVLQGSAGTGPTMNEDGVVMFHADHNNLLTSTGDPDVAALANSYAKFLLQTGLNGKPLGLRPTWIAVPPEKLAVTQQLINSIVDPSKQNGAMNPYANALQIITSPFLSTGATDGNGNTATGSTADWYLGAPEAGGLVYGFIGSETPELTMERRLGTLATQNQVVLRFGAGAEDFRGLQKNDHT